MFNTVDLSRIEFRTMPPATHFRVRCYRIVQWLDEAQRHALERHRAAIGRLQRGFQSILDGLDSGRYQEQHLPSLVSYGIRAINSAVLAIWSDAVPPGMIPSQIEYAPGAPVLLVGERPGQVEIRTGIPFCDMLAARGSRCVSCGRAERCYSFLFGLQREPARPRCQPEPDEARWLEQALLERGGFHNAGELLRDLLLEAGLYRSSWPWQQSYRDLIPVSLTNLYPASVHRDEETEYSSDPDQGAHLLHDAPLWLLAVTALLIQPKVTVLFGYRAANAAHEISGNKSGMFHSAMVRPAPPFGYTIVTFHPVNLLRETNEWKREMMQHSIRNALLKAADIANDSIHWPFAGADDVFSVQLYQDSLQNSRRDDE